MSMLQIVLFTYHAFSMFKVKSFHPVPVFCDWTSLTIRFTDFADSYSPTTSTPIVTSLSGVIGFDTTALFPTQGSAIPVLYS